MGGGGRVGRGLEICFSSLINNFYQNLLNKRGFQLKNDSSKFSKGSVFADKL